MTRGQYHSNHRRTQSGPNMPKLRTSRPTLYRRSTSLVIHSISKLGSGHVRSSELDNDYQLDMAASFLNFCAMCERQITVPDNSLLYCSEICRRKDSHKPLLASFPPNSPMSSSTTPTISPPISPRPISPRTIVAPMTPTRLPIMSTPAIRIPDKLSDTKTEEDPSEWKPVISIGPSGPSSLCSSEAWNYLSRFHGGSAPLMRRSKINRHSTSSLSTLMGAAVPLPSLAHTPSTIASSVSSTASDYLSYDPAYRPLPPRHNPCFSSSANVTKGVELVVPHVEACVKQIQVDTTTGSIFPANSTLWDDGDKTPVAIATSINGITSGMVPGHRVAS